jgi:transcriptional regulator with XRE-family HTH domain
VKETEIREAVCSLVVRMLREARERRGLSMTVLAQKAGLAQATISFFERELRIPTLDTLLRIAGVLEVELGEVILRASAEAKRGRLAGKGQRR